MTRHHHGQTPAISFQSTNRDDNTKHTNLPNLQVYTTVNATPVASVRHPRKIKLATTRRNRKARVRGRGSASSIMIIPVWWFFSRISGLGEGGNKYSRSVQTPSGMSRWGLKFRTRIQKHLARICMRYLFWGPNKGRKESSNSNISKGSSMTSSSSLEV